MAVSLFPSFTGTLGTSHSQPGSIELSTPRSSYTPVSRSSSAAALTLSTVIAIPMSSAGQSSAGSPIVLSPSLLLNSTQVLGLRSLQVTTPAPLTMLSASSSFNIMAMTLYFPSVSTSATAMTVRTIAPLAIVSASQSVTYWMIPRATSDTLTLTDQATGRIIGHTRITEDDLPTPTDSASGRISGYGWVLTDFIPTVDTPDRSTVLARVLDDTSSVSELPTRQTTGARTLGETILTTDSLGQANQNIRSLSDTINTNDSITKRIVRARRASAESSATSDALSANPVWIRRYYETFTLHESITRSRPFTRLNGDTHSTSDHFTRRILFGRSTDESVAFGDALTSWFGTQRDTGDVSSLLDDLSRSFSGLRTQIDALPNITEDLSRMDPAYRTLDEQLVTTATDALTILPNHPRALQETILTTEHLGVPRLRLAFMGYIIEDPDTGATFSHLPDWGFVLIEDPVLGNTVCYAPIAPETINPMREK